MPSSRLVHALTVALLAIGAVLSQVFDPPHRWFYIGAALLAAGVVGVLLTPLQRRRACLDDAFAAGFAAGERRGRLLGKPVIIALDERRRDV